MVVYDCEVIRPPVAVKSMQEGTYEQANGWEDYTGMGIAVVCLYRYDLDRFVIWSSDKQDVMSWEEIKVHLVYDGTVVGYNNTKFDDKLMRAHGINIDTWNTYDILLQLWNAVGLYGPYNPKTHGGYSLGAVCKANLEGAIKSMDGAMAPIFWQQGRHQEVIDYCMNDVLMTKLLLDKIFETGGLIDPRSKQHVKMALPKD